MDVNRGRRVGVDVAVVELLHGRGVRLHLLPALAVIELHPVVLAVLHLSGALQRLSEQLAQVVVVGGVLEAEVADVAEVLVELLCEKLADIQFSSSTSTYQGSCRTDP